MILSGVKTLIKLIVSLLILELAFRALFFLVFQSHHQYQTTELLNALYLGFKFDMRVAAVFSLPFAFGIILFSPTKGAVYKKTWQWIYTAVATLMCIAYFFDFFYYSYLKTRINATVFKFLQNPETSLQMVWQSYPIVWLSLAVALFSVFVYYFFGKCIFNNKKDVSRPPKLKLTFNILLVFVGLIVMMHARVSQYPLRWSEAFFSNNGFISAMALNPIHYFIDTNRIKARSYNLKAVRKHYPTVSKYLGVKSPNLQNLNFDRKIKQTPLITSQPNVIVIVMESLAAFKTSTMGMPIETTPNIDQLAKNGLLFSEFYVPSEGTARSMFGMVTGVPDVTTYKTSSRNPLIVNQNTIANAFSGYEKFYFLGGSANWGEIRGIFSNNIPGIHIMDEVVYESERVDVWGISDLDLFKESNKFLTQSKSPFFAVIQTSGFHRPYTIPEDHGSFKTKDITAQQIKDYGFESAEEYNALRFSDYALGEFINLAEKESYFNNTLFIITGDHGLPDNNAKHVHKGFLAHKLERFHVPLIFYAPKLISKPKTINTIASGPDILPTAAGITGHNFTNRSMGRNLFSNKYERYALTYVYHTNPKEFALMDYDFLAYGNAETGIRALYKYRSDDPEEDVKSQFPEKFSYMKDLGEGLLESAYYMLHHNKNVLSNSKVTTKKVIKKSN